MGMKRLSVWSLIICLMGVLALPAWGAEKTHHLRLAQTWPKNLPLMGDAPQLMATLAHEMSGGRLKITVDPSNKHKAPLGIFDMVKAGHYDMGHSASYYWKGKVPNAQYFTTMPFGMITAEQHGWFYHGGGRELMQQVYAPHGVLSFPGGNSGGQMGGWFRSPINSVADLQGLKMRIPGFAGEIMAKVGAVPTNIPPGELYTALERNTIDALEWVGPSLDLRMGFPKIARFYYTGWHEPGAELQFLINQKRFDALPDDLQAILVNAMRLAAYDTYIRFYHENGKQLAELRKAFPQVEIRSFPADVLKALKQARDALLEEKRKDDPLAEKILASQTAYLQQVRPWTLISDKQYLDSLPSEQ